MEICLANVGDMILASAVEQGWALRLKGQHNLTAYRMSADTSVYWQCTILSSLDNTSCQESCSVLSSSIFGLSSPFPDPDSPVSGYEIEHLPLLDCFCWACL